MKVIILTDFVSYVPGYSLWSCVENQCRMLELHGDNEVTLLVNKNFKGECPVNVKIKKVIPTCKQWDYKSEQDLNSEHKRFATRLSKILIEELKDCDICITHDRVFLGWALPYFLALEKCKEQTRSTLFLHQIHSMPRDVKDWWDLNRLGTQNHKLVSMTEATRPLMATSYKTTIDNVLVIPHITDIRVFADFCDETWHIIDQIPALLEANIVCIYPASSDRLQPKRVAACMAIMSAFKRRSQSVCLFIANQWARGSTGRSLNHFTTEQGAPIDTSLSIHRELATSLVPELDYGKDFIFSSDIFYPKYKHGLPKRVIRELMMCSNLFMFPTFEESWGLVSVEAALMGNYMVINGDVPVLREAMNNFGHYESFGGVSNILDIPPEEQPFYFDKIAGEIKEKMFSNPIVQTKTWARQHLNMGAIWLDYYEPIFDKWKDGKGL